MLCKTIFQLSNQRTSWLAEWNTKLHKHTWTNGCLFAFILHIHSDHKCGILELAGESKMVNKNTCSKRERSRDLVCPWPVWLICCGPWPKLQRMKHVKVHVCLDKHWKCFSCKPMNSKNEIQVFAEFRTAKNPTFQTHSSSSCLVSLRLFILAFISAITAMPVRSLRGKWKTAVILRCRLKVSSCRGSLAHHFLCASLPCWHILYCTVHTGTKKKYNESS